MVFFVCEHCNATLKKNQVDKHVGQCRNCWGVTCVDCGVTFQGDDFRAHTSCISEAQKYEGALYKPAQKTGNKKRSPQELWMDVIKNLVAESSNAPASLRLNIAALGGLDNVPRNKTKFKNFLSNSLKIRSTGVADDLFTYLQTNFEAARAPSPDIKDPVVQDIESLPTQKRERERDNEDLKRGTKKKKESARCKRALKSTLKTAPSKQMRLKKLRREVLSIVQRVVDGEKVNLSKKELKICFQTEVEKAREAGWVKITEEDVVEYLSSSQRN